MKKEVLNRRFSVTLNNSYEIQNRLYLHQFLQVTVFKAFFRGLRLSRLYGIDYRALDLITFIIGKGTVSR